MVLSNGERIVNPVRTFGSPILHILHSLLFISLCGKIVQQPLPV